MTRVLAAAALALAAYGGRLPQRFLSGIDVVRVDVLVTDGRTPIAGLSAHDFEVRDNGVPQTVQSVDRESLPVALSIALGTSGSVGGRKIEDLTAAVGAALERLRAEDTATLITFSQSLALQASRTHDFVRVRELARQSIARGGTALYDAAYAALAVTPADSVRPLLVVFSDGVDNSSWLSAEQVERAAQRSNVVIYGVAVAEASRLTGKTLRDGEGRVVLQSVPVYTERQTAFLDRLAAASGGRVIRADITPKVGAAFAEILDEFRTRYVLAYSPSHVDAKGWHAIEVKVKGRRAQVHARRGYQR